MSFLKWYPCSPLNDNKCILNQNKDKHPLSPPELIFVNIFECTLSMSHDYIKMLLLSFHVSLGYFNLVFDKYLVLKCKFIAIMICKICHNANAHIYIFN